MPRGKIYKITNKFEESRINAPQSNSQQSSNQSSPQNVNSRVQGGGGGSDPNPVGATGKIQVDEPVNFGPNPIYTTDNLTAFEDEQNVSFAEAYNSDWRTNSATSIVAASDGNMKK